jgi:aldehyde:ferredoxin oxidoreductase
MLPAAGGGKEVSDKGYAGEILRVDLSTGSTEAIPTREYAGRFLGGRGLAAGIYWQEVPPEISAFEAENRLIIALGPLAGVPALGGSRWGIYAKSALGPREHFCYGNLGGGFGAELKFAGYDGIIIQGRAQRPAVLSIKSDGVRILPADDLSGRSTVDTMAVLKKRLGDRVRMLTLGPAAEKLVPFATLLADGDASCSGGMAAVMGSKNLKAVTVQGERRRVDTADPERLREIARYIRSLGRGNVKVWGFDFMARGPNTKKMPCYGCMANCLRVKYTASNGKSGKHMCQSRFFYLPYALLYYGEENEVPFLANRACDEYGLDTWAVQDLVDWLNRCHEEGLLSAEQTGLPLSEIGSLEFIETLVEQTALRRGFGELLAKGARGAARELGENALALTRYYDPYEPRYCTINTLLFPFEPRKPIQQLHEAGLVLSQWSSWLQGVEGAHISTDVLRAIARKFWGSEQAADFSTLAGKAEAAKRIQDRQYAKECLIACDWMYPVIDKPKGDDHVGDPSLESRILSAVIGKSCSEQELNRIGERVFNLQRAILLREGHRARDDDYLPEEWHREPLEGHIADPECNVPGAEGRVVSRLGAKIDIPEYLRVREEYYKLRGWEASTGLQTRALLEALDLGEVAAGLQERGLLAAGSI